MPQKDFMEIGDAVVGIKTVNGNPVVVITNMG